ncbi:LOW QUALITY PROTEIN: small integral membrane protein 12 [Cariama cristata]
MWSVLWAAVRGPYVTFPVAFVVGLVGYHLEWFLRGDPPPTAEEEKSISEQREDRKLQEIAGKDLTKVVSLKDKLEFAPRAVLNRNRPEKSYKVVWENAVPQSDCPRGWGRLPEGCVLQHRAGDSPVTCTSSTSLPSAPAVPGQYAVPAAARHLPGALWKVGVCPPHGCTQTTAPRLPLWQSSREPCFGGGACLEIIISQPLNHKTLSACFHSHL